MVVFRIVSESKHRKILNKTQSLVAQRDVKCLIIAVTHRETHAVETGQSRGPRTAPWGDDIHVKTPTRVYCEASEAYT